VLSHLRGKSRSDGLLRLRADNLINELAILKDQESRNAANVELSSSARVLVDVQLRNLVSPTGLRRKLVQDGRDHSAWPTPFRPRID